MTDKRKPAHSGSHSGNHSGGWEEAKIKLGSRYFSISEVNITFDQHSRQFRARQSAVILDAKPVQTNAGVVYRVPE